MADGAGPATVDLVRLRGIVGQGVDQRFVEEPVGAARTIQLHAQLDNRGSCATAARGPSVSAGQAWRWQFPVHPTLTDTGSILSWGAVTLGLSGGRLVATLPDAALDLPVAAGGWTLVFLARAADGGLTLETRPVGPDAAYRSAGNAFAGGTSDAISGPLAFGRGFNGKIGAPELLVDGVLAARWDFAAAMTRQAVPGTGPQACELLLVNAPRRAVTGPRWTGEYHDWRTCPDHYDAIHFHDDDLADCGWSVVEEMNLPADCETGVYALRLSAGGVVRHAPLFVRPARPRRLAFLASTFSYLAYGNSLWASPSGMKLATQYADDAERMRCSGCSTYSRHRDGSGVGLVSTRRPLLNCRPGFFGDAIGGQGLLNDDLRILAWLDRQGEPYDVVTDHDLHEQGDAALAGREVLITGTHPEYHSRQTLDAIAAFQARAGRLVYLGGNGFYWRVATLDDAPHVMELRRAEGGIRMWAEPAGEYHHQSDGALGGLWRRLGRAPNRLVGVGYSAQGDEVEARPYQQTAAATDPRAAFLMAGVDPVFGLPGDLPAAAGYELDRADMRLGTPAHALVIARSEPFRDTLAPVNEERLTHTVLDADDPLRADLTFYETPAGGAVLSTGSVYFATALAEENGGGRLLGNALRRFLDPEPFVLPSAERP